MQSYVITGGEGFIGGTIVRMVQGVPYDLKSGLDILSENTLRDTVKNARGIFHCAAKISVPESFEKTGEYYRINVDGTMSVIRECESVGAKIVFSSSASVYGDASGAVSEISELRPQSPYAENKRDAESLLAQSRVSHISLRYFNVYGPGQSAEYAGVITNFITRALQGLDIIIYGDGNQVRDFIFVEDVARANIAAMKYHNETFEIFNIASGVETSINQLAEMIIKITGSSSKIVHEAKRIGDINYSLADTAKANNVLQWVPQVSLEEGLKKTIDYYRK